MINLDEMPPAPVRQHGVRQNTRDSTFLKWLIGGAAGFVLVVLALCLTFHFLHRSRTNKAVAHSVSAAKRIARESIEQSDHLVAQFKFDQALHCLESAHDDLTALDFSSRLFGQQDQIAVVIKKVEMIQRKHNIRIEAGWSWFESDFISKERREAILLGRKKERERRLREQIRLADEKRKREEEHAKAVEWDNAVWEQCRTLPPPHNPSTTKPFDYGTFDYNWRTNLYRLRQYLKRQPNGFHVEETRRIIARMENLAWRTNLVNQTRGEKLGTWEYYAGLRNAYKRYLEHFPDGKYAAEAERALPIARARVKEIYEKQQSAERAEARHRQKARDDELVPCTFCNRTGRSRTFGMGGSTYGRAGGCPVCRGAGWTTRSNFEKAGAATFQGPRGHYNKVVK